MKNRIQYLVFGIATLLIASCATKFKKREINDAVMQEIYNEIKTPYKYGLVMVPTDNSYKMDCPSVFRKDGKWFMTYLIYGGRGYETWLAESDDLLHWKHLGKVMSFSETPNEKDFSTDEIKKGVLDNQNLNKTSKKNELHWDVNQKAGYISLQDPTWGGSYEWEKYDNKYWMSYFGGDSKGYEAGVLSIGMAYTKDSPTKAHEFERLDKPVLSPKDKDVRWWDNSTMYKNTVIRDKEKSTGHDFIMYYNARGDSLNPAKGAERIAMAVSNDMIHWERYGNKPLINHHRGISGDAYIQRINDTWVMFYFGAFWTGWDQGAFNRFAVSNDLIHWNDWKGDNLIESSEPYDNMFAHKSFVVKHDGVVYHFYCAVNKGEQRGIAVATSKDLGKSDMNFVAPPEKKK
ncbi:glycoside hydrolase family protein [Flavobacterium cellulosilyticum]|uniref:Glycosylase n=1 Tax=Flavobacterium cellulosilyticum TaxID=2541731 RepID=A0A4R5CHM3_9FLAO|nr:glycosylase [Flavobacterium cellulosilyticum]TDD97813.1 glycosylase [Flavobacterium cellulosilyticum]